MILVEQTFDLVVAPPREFASSGLTPPDVRKATRTILACPRCVFTEVINREVPICRSE
jgi:hypothetical protein